MTAPHAEDPEAGIAALLVVTEADLIRALSHPDFPGGGDGKSLGARVWGNLRAAHKVRDAIPDPQRTALARIAAWTRHWKSEGRDQLRNTMRLVHEEAVKAHPTATWPDGRRTCDAIPAEPLDVDEVAGRFHDARYGVFAVHDGTGSPPFVEPVVACGYCRKAAERYVYAAQQRAALPDPIQSEREP